MESKQKSSVGWIALIIGLLIWWGVSYDNSHKPNVSNSSNFSTEQTTGVDQQSTDTSASPTSSLDYSTDPTSTDTTTTDASSSDTTATDSNDLSNNDYYTNVSGDAVHSPAYSSDGSIPSDATAQCNDGTYSFSQHRSGTCSYHGGVAQWL